MFTRTTATFRASAFAITTAAALSAGAVLASMPAAAQQISANQTDCTKLGRTTEAGVNCVVRQLDQKIEDANRRASEAQRRTMDAERRGSDAERRGNEAEQQGLAAARRTECNNSLMIWAKDNPGRVNTVKEILAGRPIRDVDTCAVLQRARELKS